jgi:hypothetical protein
MYTLNPTLKRKCNTITKYIEKLKSSTQKGEMLDYKGKEKDFRVMKEE